MSQKTIGEIYADDPAALPLDGTEQLTLEQSAATAGVTVSDLQRPPMAAKSASHVILDVDADVFNFSGASGDGTFTLPTLADNQGRAILLNNLDSTHMATLDGEDSETIDGKLTFQLPGQYNHIMVLATPSTWKVLDVRAVYDSGWVNQADLTDLTQTITHNLGVQIDQLHCEIAFATAADGTGARRHTLIAYDGAVAAPIQAGVNFQGNSEDPDSVILQTGADGVAFLSSGGGLVEETGSTYDYYRVVITRIK